LRDHPQFKAYVALIAVYFFWGTTYLAIRMALEDFPPMVLLAVRFLLSGGLMLAGAAVAHVKLPRGRELWLTALYGVLILGGGNGALVFAEEWIPSGLAALFITTSPFWMVGIERLLPGGERLHMPTIAGILTGFLGVVVLVGPGASGPSGSAKLVSGFLLLQLGCICWTFGSLLQRRQPTEAHPVIGGAVQQLATGVFWLLPMLLMPQPSVRWSMRGVLAVLYLVTFGSIIGYSAYVYALEKLPVAVVSTYTYVNPVVAVFLGWLFYREPFGIREMAAMVLIFLGVGIVKYYTPRS
jgi:drug/metabolite transporter (DMT)-like permease